MKGTTSGIWTITIILPVLSTACYFILINWAWHSIGWVSPGSHVFGILIFLVSCAGYPLWFSYNAHLIQQKKGKSAILIRVLIAIFVALFIYFSDYSWAHESGYLSQYHDNVTLFMVMAKRIFEIIVGLAIYVVFYKVLHSLNRENTTSRTIG